MRSASADVTLPVFADRADERFRLLFIGLICKLESAIGVFTALVFGVSWPAASPLEEDADDVRKDVREEARRIKSDVPTTLDSIFVITTACKVLSCGFKQTSSESSGVLPSKLERLGIEDAMRKERRLGRVGTDGRLSVDNESGRSQPSILY
jgi:hypothetical protein